MYKAYKYRLYPTEAQKVLLERHFGACRLVYNISLQVKRESYEQYGKSISGYDLQRQLLELKREYKWQQALERITPPKRTHKGE